MSLTQEQIKNLLEQRKATGENEILYRVQLTGNHMPGMLEVVVDGVARFFGSTDDMYLPPKPPKYDPCREFREGDKVRMRERDGRLPYCTRMREHIVPSDTILTVAANLGNGLVAVSADGNLNEQVIGFYFLELVTPVENRVSFRVGDFPVDGEWSVWKDSFGKTEIISSYKIATHPHAKAAAEAERDRLNAEYRKEQE